MLSQAENEMLTRTDAGTPMGRHADKARRIDRIRGQERVAAVESLAPQVGLRAEADGEPLDEAGAGMGLEIPPPLLGRRRFDQVVAIQLQHEGRTRPREARVPRRARPAVARQVDHANPVVPVAIVREDRQRLPGRRRIVDDQPFPRLQRPAQDAARGLVKDRAGIEERSDDRHQRLGLCIGGRVVERRTVFGGRGISLVRPFRIDHWADPMEDSAIVVPD